ncbi:hypothetical protein R1flu_024213 [Riccia fluitans]|uniref:DNA mismatch repair protein n=1 Tax=Riccia fluitans TaxID=41844 RepID=A0ABD1XX98_9MARC
MPQQRSLFSFYSTGGGVGKLKGNSSQPDATQGNNAEVSQRGYGRGSVHMSQRNETLSQKDILESIERRMCRGKIVKSSLSSPLENESQQVSLFCAGNKRIREQDEKLTCPVEELLRPSAASVDSPNKRTCQKEEKLICPVETLIPLDMAAVDISNSEKRRKLIQAAGADDGIATTGAWAEARAKFEWMTPSKVMDGERRKPSHPLYDDRTLHIPEDIFQKFSASQKQYWATKCKYMDTVLFFKVGKFYELYELDAEVGHKELDWKLTVSGVGKCRQVGCPESGIDDAVQKLVSRGCKVGRMEQIETAEQARAKRGDKATVQRELVQVVTPSTVMDGNIRPEAVHLLAIKEEVREATSYIPGKASNLVVAIGFAFVDAAAGRFYVGSLSDDVSYINLKTLLTQVAPQEVLYEQGGLSKEAFGVLRRSTAPGLLPVNLTPLQPSMEFMEADDAIRMFRKSSYFRDSSDDLWHRKGSDSWPAALKTAEDKLLATSALGALASHLIRMKCDNELLPNGLLCPYEVFKGSLRLDGQTVSNLELLENRDNGGTAGTLLSYLDSCVTRFGKRLLRRWICHPLRNVGDIQYRLDAVEELNSCPEIACFLRAGLGKLPDLERLIARIRTFAASPLARIATAAKKTHQRQLKAFCSMVLGLRAGVDLLSSLQGVPFSEKTRFNSELLQTAAELPFPKPVQACLKELEAAIDVSPKICRLYKSQEDTSEGDNDDWEARRLSQLIDLFNEHTPFWGKLVEMLGQIDVLISFASTIVAANGPTCRPQFVQSKGLGKGGSVLEIKSLWHPYASGGQDGAFVPNDIELGRVGESRNVPHAMLLTGPNMGGKSTLLRATCLAVILAQLGCYVPGVACTISPVDTIFTRLGASDRIMAGESTFMVECNEASSVLNNATSDSLVILDELGRGTSTHDGYAIAYAVFHRLVNALDCRLIFATHYHALTEEFAANPHVSLCYMACAFQSRSRKGESSSREEGECDLDKELVFLYKLTAGASPKSFGLQVALRGGIPTSVVKSAHRAAQRMQESLSHTFCLDEKPGGVGANMKQLLESVLQAGSLDYGLDSFSGKKQTYEQLLGSWQTLQSGAGSC